eukprot:5559926-Prymnesium_polylepis.1
MGAVTAGGLNPHRLDLATDRRCDAGSFDAAEGALQAGAKETCCLADRMLQRVARHQQRVGVICQWPPSFAAKRTPRTVRSCRVRSDPVRARRVRAHAVRRRVLLPLVSHTHTQTLATQCLRPHAPKAPLKVGSSAPHGVHTAGGHIVHSDQRVARLQAGLLGCEAWTDVHSHHLVNAKAKAPSSGAGGRDLGRGGVLWGFALCGNRQSSEVVDCVVGRASSVHLSREISGSDLRLKPVRMQVAHHTWIDGAEEEVRVVVQGPPAPRLESPVHAVVLHIEH